MTHIKTLFIALLAGMILFECGTADSKESKQAELDKYKAELAELQDKIRTLEEEISAANPDSQEIGQEVLVTSIDATPSLFYHQIEVRGAVESRRNVMISAETMGRIEKINVDEGEFVKKGQVLIELDADMLRNSIAEVETSIELAAIVFERQKNLWDQNIGTEIQYLQAKNNKETLERRLATLKSQLSQYIVTAPFSGTIDDIPARVGEMAQPGFPLIRVLNHQDMYIKGDVSEAYLGRFKADDRVEVFFPIQDLRFKSSISSVSKVINVENRTFVVEVALPPASDFVYQPNQVVILNMTDYVNEKAISVPTRLIQTDGDGKYVYVVDKDGSKNVARKARIVTGLSFNSKTEILEGLSGNEKVIDEGFRDVSNGSEVKLLTANL